VKEKIEKIVREVVLEYFKSKNMKDPVNKKELFIVLEEVPTISQERIWATLSDLSINYNVSLCLAKSWSKIPENLKYKKKIELETEQIEIIKKEILEADLIFVPALTLSTLAKLALTMDDQVVMRILLEAQFGGKQLLLANDSLIPKGEQKITIPHSIQKKINSYLKQLREDSVGIVSIRNASRWIETYFENYSEARPIVLARHIEEVFNEGNHELLVPQNSLVTPMSKEYARNLGISIKYKE
jgi:hypothetical protein